MPAVGFQNGASPFGALQMIGNVWELVDEAVKPSDQTRKIFSKLLKPPPGPDEPWYLIRGGSYAEKLDAGVAFDGSPVPIRARDRRVGFRCVKDAP